MRLSLLLLMVVGLPACIVFGDDDVPPTCVPFEYQCADDCCDSVSETYFTCSPSCPRGTRVVDSGRCSPTSACRLPDASVPDAYVGCPDAGLAITCIGGACCDDEVPAFVDEATCEQLCPSGYALECTPEPLCAGEDDCAEPSDCTVVQESCCGTCSPPTLEEVVAIRTENASSYRDLVCGDGPVCPPCVSPDNPSLVATCNATRCRALDLRALPASACPSDGDCILRTASCCECDSPMVRDALIAIRPDGILDLLTLVCDGDARCDECVPSYPDDVEAYCGDDGHCAVR